MYKLKILTDGKFELLKPDGDDAVLRNVNIRFPEAKSEAGGKTTYHISGKAIVSVVIVKEGNEQEISPIGYEFE